MSKENKSTEYILQRLAQAKRIIDECMEALPSVSRAGTLAKKKTQGVSRPTLNFELNERTFIRTYGKNLSGPKKFVLLLARASKGKTGIEVKLELLRTQWNKMTSKGLMGYKFNLFYSNDAKTRGWIDSKKAGSYYLCDTWMEIFD